MKTRSGYVSNSSSSSFIISYNKEIKDMVKAFNREVFESGDFTTFNEETHLECLNTEDQYKKELLETIEEEKRQGRTEILYGTLDYHEGVGIRMMEFLSKYSDKFKVIYTEEC